jgi:hypothetical protein
MLNRPDQHPRNITQTWEKHNYNNTSTGLRQGEKLGIYTERARSSCVPVQDGCCILMARWGWSHTQNTSGGIRDLCHMPVRVTYNTSCNHKHCTLTVMSTRTYYPTSERRTVTIRSSCIYPANKENSVHIFIYDVTSKPRS